MLPDLKKMGKIGKSVSINLKKTPGLKKFTKNYLYKTKRLRPAVIISSFLKSMESAIRMLLIPELGIP